jgi:hypothetical protein
MGGLGSGRHCSGAPLCESHRSIDLASLRKRRMLTPGRSSALTWSWAGEQTGSITLVAQHDGVRLIYRTKDRDGAPIDIDEFIPFTYTPTMFGGHRKWLRCLRCGRGCRNLYYGGRYFRCRLCHRLRYASQGEGPGQRGLGRARKIAKRLHDRWGGATEDGDFPPEDEYDFPPKPPRMRWATYNRLEEQYYALENRWAVHTMARFARY